MARKVQEQAEVTVTLNGQAARDELKRITDRIEDFKRKAGEAYAQGDTALGDKMMRSAKQLERQFQVATKEVKSLDQILKTLNSSTLLELQKAQKALLNQMKRLSPESREFVAASEDYKRVTARINQLNAAYRNVDATQQSFFRRLSSGINRYFLAISTAVASITGLSMTFKNCATEAAKLDDIYSDVMKTTGLLHEEVAALDEELMRLDTRTSREQLLLLARDAGKLGITGRQDVLAFVEAADKINVALGEDLGEDAIRNLGKISDVFGLTDLLGTGEALTKVGSAINAVGQASTASEGYLVEFTQRLAGAMAQAKISVADTIGFASAMDQSGMKVEMASTALQQFITKMFTETATFAKYAKMEVSDFAELLETDANSAIIKVLSSLNQAGGFKDIIPMFKDMGADGVRAVSALSALATNISALTEAQRLSNEEFAKGTSLQEEFETKNNNMQARLEKSRKEFHNVVVELGQSLNPVLLKTTNATSYLIRLLVSHGKEIRNAVIAVAALTVAVKAHTIIMTVWNGLTKVGAALQATWTAAQYLSAAAVAALRGQTVRATLAMKAFNGVLNASVIGIAVAAISALTAALTRHISKVKEARQAKEAELDLDSRIKEDYKESAAEIMTLTKIVNQNNLSIKERRDALARLKELVPDYHASLNEEGRLIDNNTEAIDRYLEKLMEEVRFNAYKDRLSELQKSIVEQKLIIQRSQEELEQMFEKNPWYSDDKMSFDNPLAMSDAQFASDIQRYNILKNAISVANSELQSFQTKEKAVLSALKSNSGSATASGEDKEIESYDDALARLERHHDDTMNEIKRHYIDREISQAEYEEAVEDQNIEYLRKRLEITRMYGEDESKVLAAYLDAMVKQNQRVDGELEKLAKQSNKEQDTNDKEAIRQKQKRLQELQRVADRFKRELLSPIDEYNEEKKKLDEVYQEKLLTEEEYQKMLSSLKKKYSEKAVSETAKTEAKGLWEAYKAEKNTLKRLHEENLMSQEEYEQEVLGLRIKYAQRAAEQMSSFFDKVSSLISSLRDAELASAEAQYQKDLAAAGNNAQQKERIEQDYEKRQLEIKKKYANADMGISIAKAIAEGALAIIKCLSELGPIAGPIMAAIIGVTTAAQIATIIAQRNAIMSTSVSSTSSTSTSGQRVIANGGMKEGGYAGHDTSDDTPMGVYHANEYIAPAWMVRREPIMFRNLEQYRLTGHRPSNLSSGMKDGGFASPATIQTNGGLDTKTLNDTISKMNSTMERMLDEGVQSYMVYDQFRSFETQRKRFKKITSK